MATARGGATGKGIKLNKDGTIPKKNRRKTPMPPHRGIESSPVTQIKIGDGSIRDLLRFIGGNRELKVLRGKKAISNDEKEVLMQKGRENASKVSSMAGAYAQQYSNRLTPSDFDIARQNMREPRNMGLSGTSGGEDFIYPENEIAPDDTTIQGGPPVNPLLERGRIEAGRSGGPTVANREPPPPPPVEMPFGENPNVAPDFTNMESANLPPQQPPRPQPLKYSPYEKPQQRGAVPEAAMNVSRAQEARKYGMLGGVDEDKIREYQNRQSLTSSLTNTDLEKLSKGSGAYAYGGAVKKKKRKKKLAGGGKVSSYNY